MGGPLATVKRGLRSTFGLWPMFEARNRLLNARGTRAWQRFEDDEVARLRGRVQPVSALVATVIPTYRRPDSLLAAIASALAQTLKDHVVIVVDDGGGLPDLPVDPRLFAVSLSRNSHVLGLVRNVGIRLTESRYVAFLDDDNTWLPHHLQTAVAGLEAGAGIVYTAVERYRPDGSQLDVLSHEWNRREFSDVSGYVDSNSIVIRRDSQVLFSRLPRTKSTLPKEDWEFIYRLSRRRPVAHLAEPTVRYLVNTESYYTDWNKKPKSKRA